MKIQKKIGLIFDNLYKYIDNLDCGWGLTNEISSVWLAMLYTQKSNIFNAKVDLDDTLFFNNRLDMWPISFNIKEGYAGNLVFEHFLKTQLDFKLRNQEK